MTPKEPPPRALRLEEQLSLWIRIAEQGLAPGEAPQHPIDELLAEHQLTDAVMRALPREAARLAQQGVLDLEFWRAVVDFIGNYIHLCHRRKEEHALVPMLIKLGVDVPTPDVERLRLEHHHAEAFTHELIDAVSEGDWEKVRRVAQLYSSLMREHLAFEEATLLAAARPALTEPATAALRRDFDAIEARALGERNRRFYLDVARRLCATVSPDALPDA